MARFDSVYPHQGGWNEDIILYLYEMLAERDPLANISHRKMPTWEAHRGFVTRKPYLEWWIISIETPVGYRRVGQCYVTEMNEIGIQIGKQFQGQGFGSEALEMLMEMHKGRRLLANINPQNAASIRLFAKYGFTLCQHTYERMP